jgi:metaxin
MPLLHIYKLFPLKTLPPAALSTRCCSAPPAAAPALDDPAGPERKRDPAAAAAAPVQLYVFSDAAAARASRPSINPSCLRAQVILALAGVPVTLVPSSNHASPSGSLPFLVPAATASNPDPQPISTETGIIEHAAEFGTFGDNDDDDSKTCPPPPAQPYQALVDGPIRCAWLHALYLCKANAPLLNHVCAASSSSGSWTVHALMAHQLREAAAAEIETCTRTRVLADGAAGERRVYLAADRALAALNQQLHDADGTGHESEGVGEWFFGAHRPGVFDAEVFAYTALILENDGDDGSAQSLPWVDRTLGDLVRKYPRLVAHRARICRQVRPYLVV